MARRRQWLPTATILFAVGMAGIQVNAQGEDLILNIEVDYMVAADHTHAPDSAFIAGVTAFFACEGITVVFHLDDSVSESSGPCAPEDWACAIPYFETLYDHKNDPTWRRAVLLHEAYPHYGGNRATGRQFRMSGPGNSPGGFLHELGHTLMLPGDDHRPNHPSVMCYRFLKGVASGMACDGLNTACAPLKEFDYSHGDLPTLDESNLDERIGIGLGPVDWDCDGEIDSQPLAMSIEQGERCGTPFNTSLDILLDFDEWQRVKDVLVLEQTAGALVPGIECVEDLANEAMQTAASVMPEYYYAPCFHRFPDSLTRWRDEPCTGIFPDHDGDGREYYCDPCPNDPSNSCCCRVPGDFNHDGETTLPDYSALIGYCFGGGVEPQCLEEADVTSNGVVDIGDVLRLHHYLYWSLPDNWLPLCGAIEAY